MNKQDSNIAMLEIVAAGLRHLTPYFVFVGGATTALYIDDKAAPYMRPTDDVDCIVEVASLVAYSQLENDLRLLGFKNAMITGEPICRWFYNGTKVDIMPTDASILGFSNRWHSEGLTYSQEYELPSSKKIRILSPSFFIASKIEAFLGRGQNDYQCSKDIEDIITVLDGRSDWLTDFINETNAPLRAYLVNSFRSFLEDSDFLQSIIGHLPPDPSSKGRAVVLVEQLKSFSGHR